MSARFPVACTKAFDVGAQFKRAGCNPLAHFRNIANSPAEESALWAGYVFQQARPGYVVSWHPGLFVLDHEEAKKIVASTNANSKKESK